MADNSDPRRFRINFKDVPIDFPTGRHSPAFWEALGRAVGSFGFLEEVLGRAIFALTATRKIKEDEVEAEFGRWVRTLEKALSDPLGNLIPVYAKSLSTYHEASVEGVERLIDDLKQAARLRNVLCHGSWRPPDSSGKSVPLFVNSQMELFEGEIDVGYLQQVQRHVAGLICGVMDSVTFLGFRFPGSNGPGLPITLRFMESDDGS